TIGAARSSRRSPRPRSRPAPARRPARRHRARLGPLRRARRPLGRAALRVEDFALFFHLIGAFLLVAGPAVAGVAFESARRRDSPGEIALLLGLARIGAVLVVFGMLVALAFGLWLVHLGDWGYGAGWVDAAIALLVVAALLGAAGGQTPKRARLLASRLAGAGQPISD